MDKINDTQVATNNGVSRNSHRPLGDSSEPTRLMFSNYIESQAPSEQSYGFKPPTILRDFGVIIKGDGSPESLEKTSQKIAAHAVVRDLLGLPVANLRIYEGDGFCKGRGEFIKPQTALRLALAGEAWSVLGGDAPCDQSLGAARWIKENCSGSLHTGNSVTDSLSSIIYEVMRMLIDHREFILQLGATLVEARSLHYLDVWSFLNKHMTEAKSAGLLGRNFAVPFSLSGR